MDIIQNSLDKPYLKFSDDIFQSLINLKKWNYEHIYNSKEATKNLDILEGAFTDLFYHYLNKLDGRKNIEIEDNMNKSDKMLFNFVNDRTEEYKKVNDIRKIVIDYISGQTDKFFLKECRSNLNVIIN